MKSVAPKEAMKDMCVPKLENAAGETPTETRAPLKDITKSLQLYSDFNDLSHVQGFLHNAQSVIQTVKIKRHDIEAALLNEKKRLEDELDTERKLYVYSGTALRQQLDLARDQTLTLKTTVADLEFQTRTLEGKCTLLREEQAEGKRKLEQAEMTCNSLQDEKNILETDILTLRGERDRLRNDNVVIQTELERERKKTLCQLCTTLPRDTLYFPCLHLSSCFACSMKYRKRRKTCHSCQTTIKSVLQLADHQ
ncbi:unnamed protein product [Calypogeia fissa]